MSLPPIFSTPIANISSFNESSFTTTVGGENGAGEGNTSNLPFSAGGMVNSILTTTGHVSPLAQFVLFFYRLLGTRFGLDPSMVLAVLGFVWGALKIGSQIYDYVRKFVDDYLMCAMYVTEDDHIHMHLMKWLSHQPSIRNSRYLMAKTVWKSAWEEEDELEETLILTNGGEVGGGNRMYLNFSNQAARSSPRFVPAMGSTSFWHKGTYFRVHRKKEAFANTPSWGGPTRSLEEIKISCFGRSIDPIKHLLSDAKALYYEDTRQKTTIYRPKPKEQRRDHNTWQQVARRPVRPMSTVVLDSGEKHDVLADVNEYLHPATPRWYASRGIPLRRGYLFHGPPGTGKTSFSFALAGVFGIDIYVISLQDAGVNEEDLATLFTKLPRRCIVLLEDIDTAGLRRDLSSENEDNGEASEGEAKDKKDRKKKRKAESDGSDGESESEQEVKPKKRESKTNESNAKNMTGLEGISLSGLLNAIDGVASHEGRVLIMTTNKPEALDEALIRPGRVDVQVKFSNASSIQAAELFHRMYEASRIKETTKTTRVEELAEKTNNQTLMKHVAEELDDITAEELKAISEEFGQRIPEGVFSPAEIQGFLLKRKKFPRRALDEVSEWVEASLRQKEVNSKVSTVQ
ncbi:mitochondrial chaperone bcs1 [Trichoderma arundinaceum]|uniref:Mitochondrial chaperone bcs1 n=1 Tax=Trichoderma arundinaceum TaxID=490622 RepID=A0A395NH19_TRIAR|nr:mitochondrial chaperone bcs1 [Trichoderma arundinaceum]